MRLGCILQVFRDTHVKASQINFMIAEDLKGFHTTLSGTYIVCTLIGFSMSEGLINHCSIDNPSNNFCAPGIKLSRLNKRRLADIKRR